MPSGTLVAMYSGRTPVLGDFNDGYIVHGDASVVNKYAVQAGVSSVRLS